MREKVKRCRAWVAMVYTMMDKNQMMKTLKILLETRFTHAETIFLFTIITNNRDKILENGPTQNCSSLGARA